MTRPLRIEYPGAFYHITCRGNRKQPIFHSDEDRVFFLGCLREAHERYGLRVHAYCLMGNHYHFFAETPDGRISKIMHLINTRYSNYFNKKHGRTGHTFQSRFRAILVEARGYALELTAYIHLNPVRAEIVRLPEEYEWSDYRVYLGLAPQQPWNSQQRVLRMLGKDIERAKDEYRRFVLERMGNPKPSPLEAVDASGILGTVRFIGKIKKAWAIDAEGPPTFREVPQARHLRAKPSLSAISATIERAVGESNRLKKMMMIWIAHGRADYSLKDLAAFFGMSISGISNNYRKMSKRLATNEVYRRIIEDALRQLNIVPGLLSNSKN